MVLTARPVRCPVCRRLLFKVVGVLSGACQVEIKCRECQRIVTARPVDGEMQTSA